MRTISLDSETTGGSPRLGDRACEIGLVEMVDGRRTGRTWSSYFNPKRKVHFGALRVHGVNGGVKFGHCGGAKVGQFGASALERAALI